LHVLYIKVAPGKAFTSWSQHHFVAIRKNEQQVHKALSNSRDHSTRSLDYC